MLPALNEEEAVASVVASFVVGGARVVVVDNGSEDRTATVALGAGAEVVTEPRRGYGAACLRGLVHLRGTHSPDIVVFCDCDGTVDARDLPRLLAPIRNGRADLVLGRRRPTESGALPPHQRLGNASVAALYRLLFGTRIHDPSPFRALRWSLVERLRLSEMRYGLPMEMIAQATRAGARIDEVAVRCFRRRSGASKVAGTVGGSLRAGVRMGWVLVRGRLDRPGGMPRQGQ